MSARGIVLALITVALSIAFPRAAFGLPEGTWVIAIGNNRGDAADEALLYAERDAREMSDVLRQNGGISSDRIRVLIDEDASALRRAIVDINAAIRSRPNTQSSALVVFYSGHADAEALHVRGTRLALDELRSLVQGSAASFRLLVIDACRSGTITRVKGVAAAEPFPITLDDRVESEGMAVLSSSAAGELSQESDRLRSSFFSHHLVNALRGAADRDGDGRVTLGEAYAYTFSQTVRSSGQTMTLQHPTYSFDIKGRSDVVLTSPANARLGRLRLGPAALYVISEERDGGPIVAEVSPSRDGAVLALPAGRYFVQQREPNEYRESNVRLEADVQVDLLGVPYRSVRYDQLVRKRGGDHALVNGVYLLAGARGGLVQGEGVLPNLMLGYNVDMHWATVGVRVRGGATSMQSSDGALTSRDQELGFGVVLQHVVDLNVASVGFGISAEGIYAAQNFTAGNRDAPSRAGGALAFGALLTAERRLEGALNLRVEGGPIAIVYRRGLVDDGVQTGSEVGSLVTWWIAGGGVWRF